MHTEPAAPNTPHPQTTTPLRLLREPEARSLAGGMARTTFRDQIRAGELPPPVKVSERCSAWLASELEACNRARVRGESRAAIRELVADLVRARGAA